MTNWCWTIFRDTCDEDIVRLFRPFNGHPEVHGPELARILSGMTIPYDKDQLAKETLDQLFNKNPTDIPVVRGGNEDEYLSYVYVVRQKDKEAIIEVWAPHEEGKLLFQGKRDQMLAWTHTLIEKRVDSMLIERFLDEDSGHLIVYPLHNPCDLN